MTGFLSHLSPGGTVGIEVPPGSMCDGCESRFTDGDAWVAIAEMDPETSRTRRTFEIHPRCFGKLKAKLEAADEG